MRVDFHVHGALSREIKFDLSLFRRTLHRAEDCGLDTLALTDHFPSTHFDLVHRVLDHDYDYVGPYYACGSLHLLPGLEFEASDGSHVLAISDRDSILTCQVRLRRLLDPTGTCPIRAFLDSQRGLRILNIVAHPFRHGRRPLPSEDDLYSRFDAVELNARDIYFQGAEVQKLTENLSLAHHVPLVAGSDSHHFRQVGTIHNEFDAPFHSIAELKLLISDGAYSVRIHKALCDKVAAAREAKKRLTRRP